MIDQLSQLRTNSDCAIVPKVKRLAGTAEMGVNTNLELLIENIAQRDESALDQFYDHTVQRVYSLAFRITQDEGVAEEVVSDVYFQVWNQANRFEDSRGNAMAWLMIITRSRALDVVRHNKMTHAYSGVVEEDIIAIDDEPLDLLMMIDQQSAVHVALKALNDTQRQLIALAFFKGYSHQELAEFTGIPLGTVKSHLKRSLSKLREIMEESTDMVGGVR